MKILFLTDGIYPVVIGGMQKHAYYLLRNFAGTGHEITILTTAKHEISSEDIANKVFPEGVPPHIHFQYISTPGVIRIPGHYLIQSWLFSRKLLKHCKNQLQGYDIILSKGFCSWYSGWINSKKDVPLISQLHGLEMFQPAFGLKDKLLKWLLRIPAKSVIRNSDYILSYGGKIREILLRNGKTESQILEQYGGVDEFWKTEMIPEQAENRKFLYVARYEFRKGFHVLKASLNMLKSQGISPEIHLVGEIPESERQISSNLHYHGNLEAESIRNLADGCAFLLVPSLAEGFPTILVEGMARGLVPLASDVGAVNAVVNSENGWLMEPGNPQMLAARLKEALILSGDELHKMRNAAAKTAREKFNWKSLFDNLILQLQQISDDRRKRVTGQKP